MNFTLFLAPRWCIQFLGNKASASGFFFSCLNFDFNLRLCRYLPSGTVPLLRAAFYYFTPFATLVICRTFRQYFLLMETVTTIKMMSRAPCFHERHRRSTKYLGLKDTKMKYFVASYGELLVSSIDKS